MIELYKIFVGKYDSEITEWMSGKCIERHGHGGKKVRYFPGFKQTLKMRSVWKSVLRRGFTANLSFLKNSSPRIAVKVPACKMTSYSVVERGSPFSLDYRVYLSELKDRRLWTGTVLRLCSAIYEIFSNISYVIDR